MGGYVQRRRRPFVPATSGIATLLVVGFMLGSNLAVVPNHQEGGPWQVVTSNSVPIAQVIRVGAFPLDVAYNPANGLLYVTNFGSSNISVVNTTTDRVVAWIPMPFGIETVAVDTSSGLVYVAEAVYRVYAINATTNHVEWTIPLLNMGCPTGCAPHVQTYDPVNGDIYVTDLTSDNVTVIHGDQPVAVVPVGCAPNGATYDGANQEVYVANEGCTVSSPSNLTVVNGTTNRVTGEVYPVNGGPGITFDSSNGEIVTCENAIGTGSTNSVTFVNGSSNRLVASISIYGACQGAVFDPVNGYVFITDRTAPGGQDLSNVTLVDPTIHQIVLTMPVQKGPTGIAYDPSNWNIYVADSDTNNVSILPQITRLTVHESGLPDGTNWSATVGGTTLFSTTRTISFPEPNGTFSFSVARQGNLSANPSSGTVMVSGGRQWLNVTFAKGGASVSGFLGVPGETGYFVLIGIGALAALLIAAVVVVRRRRKRSLVVHPPSQPQPPK